MAVAAVAASPIIAVAAGAIAVGIVAYGAYQLGISGYEVLAGKNAYTGAELTTEERIDIASGTAGGLVGGGLVGRGFVRGKEITGSGFRIALFGNRTGHKTGELPHYHRSVPCPGKPGESLPGQGIGRHRPWDTKATDTSPRDRF